MTQPNEVESPIICSPFEEPALHWRIAEGETPVKLPGRRKAVYYYRPPRESAGGEVGRPIDLALVNELRDRVKRWREAGFPGVTRTTLDLLTYWRRPERDRRFFFAQLEAVETIIFLVEARHDFRQGIDVPRDEPSEDRREEGYEGFLRYACKMATGSGKTTVMGMVIAWSVLNKLNTRGDRRFSDTVLVVCPNVTIRDRLAELYPERDEASVYRARDIVPESLMPRLRQGKVVVTNWHTFEPKTLGGGARVSRAGVPRPSARRQPYPPRPSTPR
jgi:type III restriction enzyme